MSDRQNPYFRAAMRNESLEATCRESATFLERLVEDAVAREAFSHDLEESDESSEELLMRHRMLLELARRDREQAERHAHMRKKMEPYL